MAVGVPSTWLTGDKITATRWDAETRDQSNGLLGKPRAKLVKTVKTMFERSDPSFTTPPKTLINCPFDVVAYDYAYDGSRMAYGSTLMCNIPGWYRFTGAHFWDVTNPFATATPLVRTRNIGFGKNTSGEWIDDRTMTGGSPPTSESTRVMWIQEPPMTTSGTALIQPVRGAPALILMAQGDYVEMFVGQDTDNPLLDYVVNKNVAAAAASAAGFTTFMAAEWVGAP